MESVSPAVPPQAGTCRYPGCGNPARPRDGESGARPRYCGQAVAEDGGMVVHSAMTAFRRRRELDGAGGGDETRPVTAVITRAAAIRDEAVAAAGQLAAQLETVLARLSGVAAQLSAATPEAAGAQAEAARAQAEAGSGAARAEAARHAEDARQAREAGTEARDAAVQALAEAEAAALAREEAEARAAAAEKAAAAARDHADAARRDAEVLAARVRGEAQAAVAAAARERDAATAEAAAASAAAQAAREEAARDREEHRQHASSLARAHQAQLGTLEAALAALRGQLQRAEAAADAERAERRQLAERLAPPAPPRTDGPQAADGLANPAGPATAGPASPENRNKNQEEPVSELTVNRIAAHARRLGLRLIAEDAAALIQRASDAQLGYAGFLDLALGEEAAAKEDRRFASALRQAGLPHHKTLHDFDFAFQPGLDARKVRDLAALTFTARVGNIAFLGPPGTGKTHLACAIAVSAVSAGHSAYFTTLDDMVRKLRTADAAGELNRQLRTYLRSSILIIDEVGYLPLDRRDANLVFQVIARRYEKGSVIITSNKTFSEWGQVFTDEVLATAILDRFLHHCDVITINGPSWRMKNQKTGTGTDAPAEETVP